MSYPIPENETQRLEALHSYAILDTEPEEQFDELTRLAAMVCGTPIALVSLVDTHRQWFKSKIGLDFNETPRQHAFCAYVVATKQPLVVPDACLDSRFETNPMVVNRPHIRFYAGMPLVSANGYVLGALCVIARAPRQFTPDQAQCLQTLAHQVMAQISLRKNERELMSALQAKEELMKQVQQFQLRFWNPKPPGRAGRIYVFSNQRVA